MSYQNSKKNSFRQATINRNKPGFKIHKIDTQNFKSLKKLPSIKDKKCTSSKNLIVSNTCEINAFSEPQKICYLNKLKKKFNKRATDKFLNTEDNAKYFFHKRQLKTLQFVPNQLKKYSSCNKLTSFPSIPQIQISNDESFTINENIEPQRQIKSSNSIKLQTQYILKPKIERIIFKKILKNNMSKTINPRKLESENSIELQNEQKNIVLKKKRKLTKDQFQRIDSKTKILVKNPFHKLSRKHLQNVEKMIVESENGNRVTYQQPLSTFEEQFRLSKIFQDAHNQSQISVNGKSQIEDLIGFM